MRLMLIVAVALVVLGACAPRTTVVPIETEEVVLPLEFQEVFSEVARTINTQPFPSDSGGWVITQSDQVGGFIAAELSGVRRVIFQGLVPYRAVVSVAFIDRDSETALNISSNGHEEAVKLVAAIRERLNI